MAKKFTALTTASQINETDITAISQETGGVWGSFKATISAIAQKIITGINFANAFNTNDKTVAGAVNEKLTSTAVAYIEVSPAESTHSVGEYIIYNGILYKVTSAISIGDSLAIGTNIAAETLNERIDNVDLTKGGTIDGDLIIDDNDGTTTSVGDSYLILGNNKAQGTTGNSRGVLRMHALNDKYVNILSNGSPSTNIALILPDKAGTIALTSDIKKYRLTHASFTWNEGNKFFASNDKLTDLIGNELLLGITGDFTNGSALLGWRINNQGYIIVMGWIPNLASVIDSGYQFELFILTKVQ